MDDTKDIKDAKEVNTEQFILQCAEEVFLERGFDGAKTTEIARRAGVNHAMLHYYFRTKQNLFNVVFQNKLGLLTSSIADSFSQDLPFFDKLRLAIETHFDFISENPRLLFFIYSEIVNNDERKLMLVKTVVPKAREIIGDLEKAMDEEVAKGTIRKIKPVELMLNIVALNVTTYLAHPMMEVLIADKEEIDQILQARKESNVEFIVQSLKVEKSKPTYTQATLDFGF